ncbi:MAG: hypothetical protein LBJ17_05095 [Dysgonamonadaceae bacterium]|jgi:hypothetical protein|nr:hypothetical protein [Dysgonamonadaceae bacterium]
MSGRNGFAVSDGFLQSVCPPVLITVTCAGEMMPSMLRLPVSGLKEIRILFYSVKRCTFAKKINIYASKRIFI